MITLEGRVHHTLRRPPPGDPPRRSLPEPAALRSVPLAHYGPDSIRAGPEGDDSGARMMAERQIPAPGGRHRIGGVLVSGRAPRGFPQDAGRARTLA